MLGELTLATFLSGRYVEIPIYPFSFKEFLETKGLELYTRDIDSAYIEYEQYGGFPAVITVDKSMKDTVLAGISDSIVLNDVMMRAGIKNTSVLIPLLRFLADNVGQLMNPNKIVNTFQSSGVETTNHTVDRYLELLENAYLFFRVRVDGKDIDFIARKATQILYVQVAVELPKSGRETENLLRIQDNHKKIIVTGRYYDRSEIDGIPILYVVDWLLSD